MDDAVLVRRFERFGDLSRDGQCLIERDGTARDPLRKVLTFDQFKNEGRDAIHFFQAVDVRDVGVIERGEDMSFATETCEPIRIAGDTGQQHLDRHVPVQLRVPCAIHLAHTAGAECGDNFVRPKPGAGSQLRKY